MRDGTTRRNHPMNEWRRWHSATLAVVVTAAVASAGDCDPFPMNQIWTGTHASRFVLADFDGDGDLDCAQIPLGYPGVTIHSNAGDGHFDAGHPWTFTGIGDGSAWDLSAGDVDGDGDVDLVVTGGSPQHTSLLLNDGTGALQSATPLYAGLSDSSTPGCDLVDLDQDGDLDLTVGVGGSSPSLLTFTNGGTGSFTLGPVYALQSGASPRWMRSGDLDGDGDFDVVVGYRTTVPNPSMIQTFTNVGGATLAPGVPFVAAPGVNGVELEGMLVRDLDGDGAAEIAWVDGGAFKLRVRYANGSSAQLVTGSYCYGIGAGDVDNDGDIDLLASDSGSPSAIGVYRNAGGAFGAEERNRAPNPAFLATGDIDGDGDLDILDGQRGSACVINIFRNTGAGDFPPAVPQSGSPAQVDSMRAIDVDGDSDVDIVYGDHSQNLVVVKSFAGALAISQTLPLPDVPLRIVAADFDGDSDADVVMSGSSLWLLTNSGTGTFAVGGNLGSAIGLIVSDVADVDADGDVDILALQGSTSSVVVLANQGTGTFAPQAAQPTGIASPTVVLGADMDGDGDVDVVCAGRLEVQVLLNDGSGSFAGTVPVALQSTPPRPPEMVLGDLDRDGDVDVCLNVESDDGGRLLVCKNDGTGQPGAPAPEPLGGYPTRMVLADLDGDGAPELLALDATSLLTLENHGDGSFEPPLAHLVHSWIGGWPAAADFTGDGRADVLVCATSSTPLSLYVNSGTCDVFETYCDGDGSVAPCPCANNGTSGHGCANSAFATGAALTGAGTPSVALDSLQLTATNMTGSVAVFFQGATQTPPTIIDDGLGCVGGPIVRLGTKVVSGNTAMFPEPGDPLISVRGAIPPAGATRYYQTFYRNAVAAFCPPATSNRSNGSIVVWRP